VQRWWKEKGRRQEVNKLEYKFNEIKKLEVDVYDLTQELNKALVVREEADNIVKGIKEKIELKKGTLDREYLILKDLFVSERNK
jgi:hypothetical protein